MVELSCAPSSEEHTPRALLRNAAAAEEAGFTFEKHRGRIEEFVDAGFDHVYVHQVGPTRGASSASARASSWPAPPSAPAAARRRA